MSNPIDAPNNNLDLTSTTNNIENDQISDNKNNIHTYSLSFNIKTTSFLIFYFHAIIIRNLMFISFLKFRIM